ncbi:MAG: hypothetical protein ACO3NL_02035 [Phycisphaerales bacterium]
MLGITTLLASSIASVALAAGPAPAVAPCLADLNGDGVVNGADLGLLLANWGKPGATDLDGNGTTDGADQAILMGAWGPCPTQNP